MPKSISAKPMCSRSTYNDECLIDYGQADSIDLGDKLKPIPVTAIQRIGSQSVGAPYTPSDEFQVDYGQSDSVDLGDKLNPFPGEREKVLASAA